MTEFKPSKSKIVRYDNDLNAKLADIEFQKFKPAEQNLFFAICSKMKYREEELVIFTFQELKELAKYNTGQSKAELFEDLDALLDKLQNIKLKIDNGEDRVTYTLFPIHKLSRKTETAEIKIGTPFVYLLNGFKEGGWTRYELDHFTQLESRYSKTMFRILKRWRMKGVFSISVERLKKELSIPDSYLMADINRRVLGIIEKELSPLFENFKITRHKSGRKITSLTFSFKKEKTDAESEYGITGEGIVLLEQNEANTDMTKRKKTEFQKKKNKTETLPDWVGKVQTETPLAPEVKKALDARISGLKTSGSQKPSRPETE